MPICMWCVLHRSSLFILQIYTVMTSEPINITWYFHGWIVQYHFMFLVYWPIRIAEISPSYNNQYYYMTARFSRIWLAERVETNCDIHCFAHENKTWYWLVLTSHSNQFAVGCARDTHTATHLGIVTHIHIQSIEVLLKWKSRGWVYN